MYESIPEELKALPRWVCWKRVPNEKNPEKIDKLPINAKTGGYAESNNPDTWTSFNHAVKKSELFSGIGFMLGGGYFGVDLDHVEDAIASYINHDSTQGTQGIVSEFIEGLQSYAEYSVSGTGIHIICKGSLPRGGRKSGGVEMYDGGRFFVMTGNIAGTYREIADCMESIKPLHAKYLGRKETVKKSVDVHNVPVVLEDERLIALIRASKQGLLFSDLYEGRWHSHFPSQSEADLCLCAMLAFWTGRNEVQIDRIFRSSGLMREKWDRRQVGTTYGQLTIKKAIEGCMETYNPQRYAKEQMEGYIVQSGTGDLTLVDLHPECNERYGWTDIGNGRLFADWYKKLARYVPERKKWFIFDGRRWRPDIDNLQTMELCKELADQLMVYALTLQDERQRQAYMDYVGRWQKRNSREVILKDAAGVHPVSMDAFDVDPYLFNCLNGTLNTQTGEFYSHRPDDLLSMLAGVHYDPEANSDRWNRFISEVMNEDKEKAAYLQKSLGYALTGDTRHECFFILYGPTSRNGKGTCMETFMRMIGDYGKSAKPETIAQKQAANGSGPSEDIARLVGARFVNISEPDKKLVLSSALVKTLTGNDTITARYLHENSFEYRPKFKLFINTNHLPAVTDATLFGSGRVKTIPFDRHFGKHERDESLKGQLTSKENLSGILNWCLQGLLKIYLEGFDEPEAVREATEDYRHSNDKIGRFLAEEMEEDSAAETRTGEVYNRYKSWCITNGFHPENASNFKASLSNVSNVVRKRPDGCGRDSNPVSLLIGYKLKPFFTVVNEPTPWN